MSSFALFAANALALAVLLLTAFAAGKLLITGLARREPSAHSELPAAAAFCLTLGLAGLATIGVVLGLAGALTRTAVLVSIAAVHLLYFFVHRDGGFPRFRFARRAAAVCALFSIPYFVLALYPPVAFDETLYHLPYARAFVDSAALPFLTDFRFPIFPQLAEVLSAMLLVFGSDIPTHLPALIATALTTALLWSWGDRWDATRRPDAHAVPRGIGTGAIAAAIWLGNPIVTYLSGTGYVEPLLAAFVTASAYAFWLWQRTASRSWLVLCAVLAGSAAATKYFGLFFVAGFAVATLWCRGTADEPSLPSRARSLLLFGLVAGVVMAPWYGRIVAHTGNPVFPYLSGIFGENDWTPVRFLTPLNDFPPPGERLATVGRTIGRLLTLPWDVVARRERIGGLPPFSPIYLLGLPVAIAVAWRGRKRRRHAAPATNPSAGPGLAVPLTLAIAFVALTPFMPPDARYLIASLPVLGLGLAVGLRALLPESIRASRPLGLTMVTLLALPGVAYAGHRLLLNGPPPATIEARDTFLRRWLPYYPAVAFVNERVRPQEGVYGFHTEAMRYHARGDYRGEQFGPSRFAQLDERLDDPASFREQLRRWGIDYLVVARSPEAYAAIARRTGEIVNAAPIYEDRAAAVYRLTRDGPGEGVD